MSRFVQSAKIASSIVAVGAPLLFANPVSVLARFMVALGSKVLRYDPAHLPPLTSWVINNHHLIRGFMLAVGCLGLIAVSVVWCSKRTEPAKLASLLWIISASTSIVVLTLFLLLLSLFLPQMVLLQSVE